MKFGEALKLHAFGHNIWRKKWERPDEKNEYVVEGTLLRGDGGYWLGNLLHDLAKPLPRAEREAAPTSWGPLSFEDLDADDWVAS